MDMGVTAPNTWSNLKMINLAELLPSSGKGMTVSEFESLREMRRRTFAVSGFIHPGMHYEEDVNNVAVNTGIWCTINGGLPNAFRMGRSTSDGNNRGDSETEHPVYNIDGLRIVQNLTGASSRNSIYLPPAPMAEVEASTTTSRDYKPGDHVINNNNIYITVSDAPSGMLLSDVTYFKPVDMVSREDLVGMEVFLVEIGNEGGQIPAVFPLGNVQYNGNTSGTKNYTDGVMPQSYSAFGSWDTVTWGRGFTWDKMSEEHKTKFINDPDNNVYLDGDRVYQWQYRIRSVPSIGDDWRFTSGYDDAATSYVRTSGDVSLVRLSAQGSSIPVVEVNSGRHFYQINSQERVGNVDPGLAITNPKFTSNNAIGSIFWMPIAKVTRLNQGAYHPAFNPLGTKLHATANGGDFYSQSAVLKRAESIADCFQYNSDGGSLIDGGYGGNIQHGFSGHPLGYTHDNIYDWQMQDLRTDAQGINIDANAFGKDLLGNRTRGWEYIKSLEIFRTTIDAVSETLPDLNMTLPRDGGDLVGGCWLYNVTKGEYSPAVKFNNTTEPTLFYPTNSYTNPLIFEGASYTSSSRALTGNNPTSLTTSWEVGDEVIVLFSKRTKYSLAQLPTLDVMARPDVLADYYDSMNLNAVVGLNWNPMLPDGTMQTVELTRKSLKLGDRVKRTQNFGDTWVHDTSFRLDFNGAENSAPYNPPADMIVFVDYQHLGKVLEPTHHQRAGSLATIKIGDVFATVSDNNAPLIYNLTGKLGKETNQAAYVKHKLERATFTLDDEFGELISSSWSEDAIRHTELSIPWYGRSDGVKLLPFLNVDTVTGLVYGHVTFKELIQDRTVDSTNTATVDLSGSVTHGLSIGDKFVIINSSNEAINNIVMIMTGTPDATWDHTSFHDYYINHEDGSVYKGGVNTIHPTFRVDAYSRYGDDNTIQYYPNISFINDLNMKRTLRELVRLPRPLGFLPKEKR